MNLPTPDPAFRWSTESWGHALRCRALEPLAQHLFTTKQLPLRRRLVEGPDPQLSWARAAAALGAGLEQVMRIKQVHGRTIRVLRAGEIGPGAVEDRPSADGLISNASDLLLAVQVADCVAILMADRRTGAAGAVHAGWRGTVAGVAGAAIEAMTREFGTNPQDLTVALGPSIGTCCYEVGPELVDAFTAAGFNRRQRDAWFARTESGSWRLDLWAANGDQIHDAGVPRHQIHVAALCTLTYADVFESYRAEGENAGRMAGLIRVPGGG